MTKMCKILALAQFLLPLKQNTIIVIGLPRLEFITVRHGQYTVAYAHCALCSAYFVLIKVPCRFPLTSSLLLGKHNNNDDNNNNNDNDNNK